VIDRIKKSKQITNKPASKGKGKGKMKTAVNKIT